MLKNFFIGVMVTETGHRVEHCYSKPKHFLLNVQCMRHLLQYYECAEMTSPRDQGFVFGPGSNARSGTVCAIFVPICLYY